LGVVLGLGAAEGALRLAGFRFLPPDTGYGVVSAPLYHREGDRFVIDSAATGVPGEGRDFRAERESGALRIAVIGGSNAMLFQGMPSLVARLRGSLHRPVEVLNFGVLSYGSRRELLLLPEILSHRPDILLVYTGHNEFEEGAVNELRRRSDLAFRFDAALRPLRIYQLASFAAHRGGAWLLGRESRRLLENGATLIPLERRLRTGGPPLDKAEVYRRFDDNLRTIVRLAREQGTDVILSTVAYNRRIPPLPPLGTTLPPDAGAAAYARGDFAAARREWEARLDADPDPHRADNRINAIIRKVASDLGVPLLDTDKEIAVVSPHGIPAAPMMGDHCHLSIPGYRVFERLVAQQIEQDPRWRHY
jgi:lysophospholipase L1-like esterase